MSVAWRTHALPLLLLGVGLMAASLVWMAILLLGRAS